MTPDEAAKRVLADQMAPSQMKFSEFRWAIISEYDDYISDDDIHNLYLKHILHRMPEISPEHAQRILSRPKPSEVVLDRTERSVEIADDFGQDEGKVIPELLARAEQVKAVDQVVEWSERNRATPDEVRRVARRVPTSQKKHWSEVTIAEALGKAKRALRGLRLRA